MIPPTFLLFNKLQSINIKRTDHHPKMVISIIIYIYKEIKFKRVNLMEEYFKRQPYLHKQGHLITCQTYKHSKNENIQCLYKGNGKFSEKLNDPSYFFTF